MSVPLVSVSVSETPGGRALHFGGLVRREAERLGFDAVGFARADVPLDRDHARYQAFLEEGMHGQMEYLAENVEARRRLDTDAILPGARSVICLARSYQRADDHRDPALARGIARYARGQDYHGVVRKKLRRLAAFVRSLGEGVQARPLIDDAPVLERAWAGRAGLGFIGKNGMLIAPGIGSYLLLGEVVTTLELSPDEPMSSRCGSCTLCLTACPTRAFPAPFVLDPRRCIAYLTIELEGPVPEELREGVGEHLFGCDDCQSVCPFNASPGREGKDTAPFRPHARWAERSEVDLLAQDQASFEELRQGSPLGRAGRGGLARNAALVLGNRRDPLAREPLARAASDDPDPGVREAARWALSRL